jgi:3-oxoacyl-[acyl-carrier-protein] synthase-3
MNAYLQDVAVFLPGPPIDNERVEAVLGMIGQTPSRAKRVILRSNGIQTRYFALDPDTGEISHSNAQLAAEAVRRLNPYPGFTPADIACLACGTATPDHVFPSQASMVHGELGGASMELISAQGACLTGLTAMKYAAMNVAAGFTANAVVAASETCSSFTRQQFFDPNPEPAAQEKEIIPFEADFIRWMVSDGAAAAFVAPKPSPDTLSFRVEWIELLSFAHELEACMYAGGEKQPDGRLVGWRGNGAPSINGQRNLLAFRQDFRLLNAEGSKTMVGRALPRVLERHPLRPDQVDWFLPHYSSEYFRSELYDRLAETGFEIPHDRWFTNLTTKGNTGSASVFIMLEELWRGGGIRPGQRVLMFVPESARFSCGYALLTAVGPE